MKFTIYLLLFVTGPILAMGQQKKMQDIVISADLNFFSELLKKGGALKAVHASAYQTDGPLIALDSCPPVLKDGRYYWTVNSDLPVRLFNKHIFPEFFYARPGDSVYINLSGAKRLYRGDGALKFQVQQELLDARKKIAQPIDYLVNRDSIHAGHVVHTLEQYKKITNNCNLQLEELMTLLDSYKSKLDPVDYQFLKCRTILKIEKARHNEFGRLPPDPEYFKLTHSLKDVLNVWDTVMYGKWAKWLRSQPELPDGASYLYYFSRSEVWRKVEFVNGGDTIYNKAVRVKRYYDNLKKNYKGLALEEAIVYLLDEQVCKEMGALNPVAQRILKDYYAMSKYPKYTQVAKSYEAKSQRFVKAESVSNIPFFQLENMRGETITENFFKGKYVILDFWQVGSSESRSAVSNLEKLQEEFANDTGVVIVHISVDRDKKIWQRNVLSGEYVPKTGMHLYTQGAGKEHEIVKNFNVEQYPSLRFFDRDLNFDVFDPELTIQKNCDEIARLIRSKQPLGEDGPYVIQEDGRSKAIYVSAKTVTRIDTKDELECVTDRKGTELRFRLQKSYKISPAEYSQVNKMLVLSDIEGNFLAFRKLLQANKVIDEKFNWIFTDGHLVFAGDMFDRGEQVTECLWLIYSLEEKAKQAGGYVHFILGNHDIMNMQGTDSYAKSKYRNNAKLIGKSIKELYDENSELGKWLRTKNVVEKIGDNLFMHGGISQEIATSALTINDINQLARPHYADKKKDYGDRLTNLVMSTNVGPFWFRNYYAGDRITESEVNNILARFSIRHIVTGHTIVADTVSVHYNGKILNTDTKHASGKSEALLIEGDRFYRVNDKGDKVLLFVDDKRAAKKTAKSQD
ncbi:MAG: metallophosphoesterase [Sediminibacterium sp.]